MKKMLMISVVTLFFAPLFAADKCCGAGKPRPAARPTRQADMTDKCGCNANKPKGAAEGTRSCGSCNNCNSCCNNKPCCK